MKIRNTFIIFVVSGFWHGANWTFIVWGALNAIYFLPLLLANKNRNNLEIVAEGNYLPNAKEFGQIVTTFALTVLAWIFFRAENVPHAFDYISGIISMSIFEAPEISGVFRAALTLTLILVFIIVEWIGRENQYAIERIGATWYRPVRYSMYYAIILAILTLGGGQQEFIYFQF